jgi:hypothetical protein
MLSDKLEEVSKAFEEIIVYYCLFDKVRDFHFVSFLPSSCISKHIQY